MKIKAGNTQIQISFLTVAVPLLLLLTDGIREYLAAFFSVALHEMGHVAVARFYGCKLGAIRIMPVGLTASINNCRCSRAECVKIYLAGPLVNLMILAASAIMFPMLRITGSFTMALASTNAYLALFNLVPAFPLDGGRILLELFAEKMGLLAAGRLAGRLAAVFAAVIAVLGLLQLFISHHNFSLAIIGLYIFTQLEGGRMERALMNIRQIIYRRSRFIKRGVYPARGLTVLKSTRLDEALKNMDFDCFHFVCVLDESLRIVRVFTESEIMDAIIENSCATFGQLLERPGESQNGTLDDFGGTGVTGGTLS